MSDNAVTLHLEHLKGQGQFAYFQLGLAASAIAFAIHQTRDATLAETPWQIGAAVAAWALSFAFGCFGVEARQVALSSNAKFLLMKREQDPRWENHPEVAHAMREAERVVEIKINKPYPRFRLQMWAMFLGAIFYIWGHLIEMTR